MANKHVFSLKSKEMLSKAIRYLWLIKLAKKKLKLRIVNTGHSEIKINPLMQYIHGSKLVKLFCKAIC